jgi:hypothetical protein
MLNCSVPEKVPATRFAVSKRVNNESTIRSFSLKARC